jgi:hypothetical protein
LRATGSGLWIEGELRVRVEGGLRVRVDGAGAWFEGFRLRALG